MADSLVIPSHLTKVCAGHPERERWLADLPTSLEECRRRWSLELGKPYEFGICSRVFPATLPDGAPAALKMAMPHMEGADEGAALRFWNGDGTVRLLDADESRHALLLERCEPGTSLRSVPEPEQDVIVAGLLRRLWRAPSAPHPFRHLSVMVRFWSDETRRDEARWPDRGLVEAGLALMEELSRSAPTDVLLATDLHAGNVLAAQREPWLAIDPKPFIGDRTYDVTQHLFNCKVRMTDDPLELIRRFADLLGVDAERARLWTFARLAAEPRDEWKPPGPTLRALAPFGYTKVRPRHRAAATAPDLPAAIRHAIGDAVLEPVRVGRSDADVWRVGRFYLKASDHVASLRAEAARLEWLVGHVDVPKVLAFEATEDRAYLLTTRLRGVGAHEYRGTPQRCVELLARGLRAWHRLPIESCPFDARLAATIAQARANAESGRVDETDFDDSRVGRTALELFVELVATQPRDEDLVVAHGDYCLPNIVIEDDAISGFVDVGRAGVADRYQDLALAARSIEYNIGAEYVAPFFAAYGVEPDPRRIAFYQLLDEFF
jgi:streptomycin 6-kinase